MPKAHELLAVRDQLRGQAEAARKDLTATFKNKRHLFEEKRVTYVSDGQDEPPKVEEISDINTTVPKELRWISEIMAKAMDVAAQVSDANTRARGDVVLDDGTVLLTNVGTVALMELESRTGEIQDLITAIPTLDPAKSFRPDTDRDKSGEIYQARQREAERTKKTFVPLVLAEATKEHPAQVKEGWQDRRVGSVVTQEWSGLVTPATKGDLLERIEELRRAVKKARMRANELELTKPELDAARCGQVIFGFVLTGKK